MGSHSITCQSHPTEVTFRLSPAKAGTRFCYPGGMQGWVNLVAGSFWDSLPAKDGHPSQTIAKVVYRGWESNPQPLSWVSDVPTITRPPRPRFYIWCTALFTTQCNTNEHHYCYCIRITGALSIVTGCCCLMPDCNAVNFIVFRSQTSEQRIDVLTTPMTRRRSIADYFTYVDQNEKLAMRVHCNPDETPACSRQKSDTDQIP